MSNGTHPDPRSGTSSSSSPERSDPVRERSELYSEQSDHSQWSFTDLEQWLIEAATSMDGRFIAVSRGFFTESASRPKESSKFRNHDC